MILATKCFNDSQHMTLSEVESPHAVKPEGIFFHVTASSKKIGNVIGLKSGTP
jgi:hypothetical protein